jgi:hypothetical protein
MGVMEGPALSSFGHSQGEPWHSDGMLVIRTDAEGMFGDADKGEELTQVAVTVGPPANALEYLQSIYRDPTQSESRRMRAAALALPFEAPKLTAVAMTSMDPTAFAEQLERAIARSQRCAVLPPPTIIDAEHTEG